VHLRLRGKKICARERKREENFLQRTLDVHWKVSSISKRRRRDHQELLFSRRERGKERQKGETDLVVSARSSKYEGKSVRVERRSEKKQRKEGGKKRDHS